MNIAILGKGKYGEAIGSLLEYNHVAFTYITKTNKYNRNLDILFLATPTQSLREALTMNRENIDENTIIINCSKGIEEGTCQFPHQIVQGFFPRSRYLSIIGPSFANGLTEQNPTIVSLGYSSNDALSTIQKIITTPYLKLVPTKDIATLELAGALKNVYAILCGYATGLGFGPNTLIRLMLGIFQEIEQCAEEMDFPLANTTTPGIIGDIILTCSSRQSRNFTYGYNIALKNDTSPHETNNNTVEGYHTCYSIEELLSNRMDQCPLIQITTQLVRGGSLSKDQFTSKIATIC